MEIQMTSKTLSYDVVLLPKAAAKETINITTTVTNDVDVAMAWIEQVGEDATIGLEVQCCSRQRHDDDSNSKKKPAILTLCDVGRCLILQLGHLGRPGDKEMIKDLLVPVERFVGVNVGHSAAMLKEEYGINVAAAGYEYEDIIINSDNNDNNNIKRGGGLWFEEFMDSISDRIVAKLMMELMIMRKKTPEVEGAVWEKEKLDEDLVAYATLESYVYYMIGEGHKYYAS